VTRAGWLVVIAACGSAPPPTATPALSNTQPPPEINAGGDTIVDHLRAYRDDMCACKGEECARVVEREIDHWRERHRELLARPRAVSTEEERLQQAIATCRTTAIATVVDHTELDAKLASFADALCACTDNTCATKVRDAMMKWLMDGGARLINDGDLRSDTNDMAIEQRMTACAAQLQQQSPPPQSSP
jgi:hypothetical protein